MKRYNNRKYFLLLSLLLGLNYGYGQINKSDLRVKVESIILNEIKYIVDSTTNKLPEMKWDTTIHRGLNPPFSNFPSNPMTLIILGGNKIEIEELDNYRISDVNEIRVYPKNESIAMAIYGTSARNGLIVIHLKK